MHDKEISVVLVFSIAKLVSSSLFIVCNERALDTNSVF